MRLLIIEDDEKLAQALKDSLEKNGYAVDLVNDGEAGEHRIQVSHKDYDAVILDLGLPRINGVDITRKVRAGKINIPILVLTGKDATNDKVMALDAGADDYLVKPFSLEELLARLRALLRRPEQTLATELNIAGIVLNTSTRKVYRNGKEIPLTLKEFSLLEYLMRHPNQVLNREQILDHIWDFAFDSFSNVVDVHIKNLRKKLDAGSKEKVLETIRGVGYRLRA
jgi:DNA-binding response OmpR family regulator